MRMEWLLGVLERERTFYDPEDTRIVLHSSWDDTTFDILPTALNACPFVKEVMVPAYTGTSRRSVAIARILKECPSVTCLEFDLLPEDTLTLEAIAKSKWLKSLTFSQTSQLWPQTCRDMELVKAITTSSVETVTFAFCITEGPVSYLLQHSHNLQHLRVLNCNIGTFIAKAIEVATPSLRKLTVSGARGGGAVAEVCAAIERRAVPMTLTVVSIRQEHVASVAGIARLLELDLLDGLHLMTAHFTEPSFLPLHRATRMRAFTFEEYIDNPQDIVGPLPPSIERLVLYPHLLHVDSFVAKIRSLPRLTSLSLSACIHHNGNSCCAPILKALAEHPTQLRELRIAGISMTPESETALLALAHQKPRFQSLFYCASSGALARIMTHNGWITNCHTKFRDQRNRNLRMHNRAQRAALTLIAIRKLRPTCPPLCWLPKDIIMMIARDYVWNSRGDIGAWDEDVNLPSFSTKRAKHE